MQLTASEYPGVSTTVNLSLTPLSSISTVDDSIFTVRSILSANVHTSPPSHHHHQQQQQQQQHLILLGPMVWKFVSKKTRVALSSRWWKPRELTSMSSRYRLVTDRQTDGQTDGRRRLCLSDAKSDINETDRVNAISCDAVRTCNVRNDSAGVEISEEQTVDDSRFAETSFT